jgi:hypothetical protein
VPEGPRLHISRRENLSSDKIEFGFRCRTPPPRNSKYNNTIRLIFGNETLGPPTQRSTLTIIYLLRTLWWTPTKLNSTAFITPVIVWRTRKWILLRPRSGRLAGRHQVSQMLQKRVVSIPRAVCSLSSAHTALLIAGQCFRSLLGIKDKYCSFRAWRMCWGTECRNCFILTVSCMCNVCACYLNLGIV